MNRIAPRIVAAAPRSTSKALLGLASAALLLIGVPRDARAGIIPYPNAGAYNATTYTFNAMNTGSVTAYFFGGSGAADSNNLEIIDLTKGTNSGFGLNNKTSKQGDTLTLDGVTAGDVLLFELQNTTLRKNAFSDPTLNVSYDNGPATGTAAGHNHIYSTNYTATTNVPVPSGTYVGFEDLPFPGSDYNYNDESFVFTNTQMAVAATPEPSTLVVSGIGLGLTMLYARRRRQRQQA